MKFSCEKNLLNEAVMTASKASSAKSSFPALEGILITTLEDSIRITGFDLDLGIECVIEANIIEKGAIVLNSKMFVEIVRKLPDSNVIIESDEKLLTNIKCDMSEYNIVGISPTEFPELPKINTEKNICLSQNLIKNMIRQTLYAISTSESKPIHTGSLFEIENNRLRIISVDGFRLALRQEELLQQYEDFSFVVPGKTLSEISKILRDTDEIVSISLAKKHILFEFDNIVVISRLLEGEFLNYRNVLPKDIRIVVKVETKKLIDSVERASLLINEKIKSPIRCNIDNSDIKITCKTVNGNVYDEVLSENSGGTLEIGFNNRYMLDALKATEEQNIRMELNTHLTPIVIKPEEGEKFVFLVLPVRLKSED